MSHFQYNNQLLHAESVPIDSLFERFGSPTYVYSRAALTEHFQAYQDAFAQQPHLICYAVKANSNIAVLNVLAKLGAGFDIVSGGELLRVIRAGGDPSKVVFSGVAKTHDEIALALSHQIRCFNVESEAELERINAVASSVGAIANISIRVNPDVDAKTHPYISTGLKDNKFGIDINAAKDVYLRAAKLNHLNITGIDCHIGSQLTETTPFIDALKRVKHLLSSLQASGIEIHHLDLGGGLGVCYKDEQPPSAKEYLSALLAELALPEMEVIIEPGRSIAANAGILLAKVEYLKQNQDKNFAIVDTAMNDMIRPALYSAWLDIKTVQAESPGTLAHYDIVGPVCETGDFLGKDRELSLQEGTQLAIFGSGAYGFTMASNYNSRGRAAEIMVDGDKAHLIRERESLESLMQGEHLLAD